MDGLNLDEMLDDLRRLVETESPSDDPEALRRSAEVLAEVISSRLGPGVEIIEGDGRASVVLPDPPPVQQPIPIWIGGNAGRTRQRVAERAQGWMPMPNPAAFAKTTRSPVLDGPDDLSRFIADLHRRADDAGRTTITLCQVQMNMN